MGQPAAPAAPAAAPHADLPRVSTFTRGDLTSAGGSGGGEGASPGSTKKGSYGASSMEGTFVAEVRWRTQWLRRCGAAAVAKGVSMLVCRPAVWPPRRARTLACGTLRCCDVTAPPLATAGSPRSCPYAPL
jgi:hypothetical protein